MHAMVLSRPVEDDKPWAPLELADVATPTPRNGEIVIRVSACGVCRTDLDIAEGRVRAPAYPVIPGHQVVGVVSSVGSGATSFREGDRVGVAWISSACGECRWCGEGLENLCPEFRSTGCDAHGGYAEYMVVRAAFAYAIPEEIEDVHAAPLLCAGAIGFRSLRLANLRDGDALGLSGFGASAHLMLQMARHRFPSSPVYVFARDAAQRAFAKELGASWAGGFDESPPARMTSIVDTTPAWQPLVAVLPHLLPGGRLVINAIRKLSAGDELRRLDYATHLWMEREIKSVANVTRADVRETLAIAAAANIRPAVEELPLTSANDALSRLRSGGEIRGALVLRV